MQYTKEFVMLVRDVHRLLKYGVSNVEKAGSLSPANQVGHNPTPSCCPVTFRQKAVGNFGYHM